ncbi:MAG: hypothetical protein ACP5F8_03330 [Candidatus Aenigmatarchaeota archaeon]
MAVNKDFLSSIDDLVSLGYSFDVASELAGSGITVEFLGEPLSSEHYSGYSGLPFSDVNTHFDVDAHLYVFPSELDKLNFPYCEIVIVEGRDNTLNFIENLNSLDVRYRYAVIGIPSLYDWLKAPEWDSIPFSGRNVTTFFNVSDPGDILSEIRLAGFLYSKGASYVRSFPLNGTDFSDFKEMFTTAIKKSTSTLVHYRDKYGRLDLMATNFFRAVLETDFRFDVSYLMDVFHYSTGMKKSMIKSAVEALRQDIARGRRIRQREKLEKFSGLKGIQFPEGYVWDDIFLLTIKGDILSEFFIVKAVLRSPSGVEGFAMQNFRGNIFILPFYEYVYRRGFSKIFMRNEIFVTSTTVSRVAEYIAKFLLANKVKL